MDHVSQNIVPRVDENLCCFSSSGGVVGSVVNISTMAQYSSGADGVVVALIVVPVLLLLLLLVLPTTSRPGQVRGKIRTRPTADRFTILGVDVGVLRKVGYGIHAMILLSLELMELIIDSDVVEMDRPEQRALISRRFKKQYI